MVNSSILFNISNKYSSLFKSLNLIFCFISSNLSLFIGIYLLVLEVDLLDLSELLDTDGVFE